MNRLLVCLALIVGLSAAAADHPPVAPPPAVQSAPETDPYQWLEDVTGERALGWVQQGNEKTLGELAAAPGFDALESRILKIMDSDERIPSVDKMGKYYYNFWRDAASPRGVWRRTSLSEYKKAAPKWELVLDVDALGKADNESWVWEGANCLPPKYVRCLVNLSRGGSDAHVVREFDTKSKTFVEGGFTLPEAKSDVSWIDLDHLWVGTDLGPETLTSSGYPRQARRWTRGTPIASAPVVFEAQPTDVWGYAWRDLTKGYERDFAARGMTFYTNEMFVLDGEGRTKIDKPDDASASVFREWLYLELRSDWTVGGRTWPAGALLAIVFDDFMAGGRDFEMLYTPTDRSSLAGFTPTRHHVLLNVLDNVHNKVTVLSYGPIGGSRVGWTRQALPGLPALGTVSVRAIDPEHSDDYFATATDFLTPTSLYLGRVGKGEPEKLKSVPAWFDSTGLVVQQYEATSKDGTKVPYFLVARDSLALDGNNPTLLYGYGGFEVPMVPFYGGSLGAGWLEKGGVYALANIRGGGEFGPKWHQAALKQNRNKAYEDFAAVAEDLSARKITSKDHLGIMGGSNGGLLMGNMVTMYPNLFEAVVCQVPLLDMQRFNKLLAGASWMGEYGNPDDPADWAWLKAYSPYHNVQKDTTYPRVLFMTSTKDDRVHPGHARKMAAKMIDQGHDVLYYENTEGGHGGAADNKQAARMWALAYTFLWGELK